MDWRVEQFFFGYEKDIRTWGPTFLPQLQKLSIIHTDAIKTQLGGVIIKNGKPIAFYSQKLNPAQINNTTTER